MDSDECEEDANTISCQNLIQRLTKRRQKPEETKEEVTETVQVSDSLINEYELKHIFQSKVLIH